MAVKLAEAYVEITARMDKLNTQLATAKGTIGQWATGLSAMVGGVAVFAAIERGFERIAAASMESAKAIQAMNLALGSSGRGGSADQFDKLSESFKALGQDDEPIKQVIATIANLSKASVADIERATAAAVGLSQVLGVGLPEATKAILKAQQGNVSLLGRMGVEFEEGATDAEKLQRVFDLAEKGIDQLAAKSTSFLGLWERAKMAIGDALEGLGGVFAEGQGNSVSELQAKLKNVYAQINAQGGYAQAMANEGEGYGLTDQARELETALSAAYAAQAKVREARDKAAASAEGRAAEADYARRYRSPISGAIGDAAGGLNSGVRGGIGAAGAALRGLMDRINSNAGDPTGGGRNARLARAYERALADAADLMGQLPGATDALASVRARIADYGMGEGRAFGQQLYNRDTFSGAPTGAIARIQLPNFGGMTASVDVPRDMLKELREQTKKLEGIRTELANLGVAP